MKLLRMHIQGFKSFKDKTTINFDEGITGIVGPNGCGKSNIVDALFWIMGEQSAKHLRGNSMKDLIFSGSSKYSPSGFAEVTLILLNDDDKHIHIGGQVHKPNEIALTRKLYRSGDSEYRINGLPARLKDIHEIFMDTGAGAKSYSIIAQGEINRLVQAKPEERRVMIEEVAGITKFKIRKRESLKKIEHTQSNINRLSDLQSEIHKQLKALEKQAERAEKAKSLKERVRRHELIVESHREHDYLNDFVNANTKLEENAIELDQSILKKSALELALEDERSQKLELNEKIELLQSEFNEKSKMLAAGEERIKHLRVSKDDKELRIEEKQNENDEIQNDILARNERRDELNSELAELKEVNLDEEFLAELEEKVTLLKDQYSEKEEKINEINIQINEYKTELNELDQVIFRNTSRMEEYNSSLEDMTKEIEELEKQTSKRSQDLVDHREKSEAAKELYFELKEKYDAVRSVLDEKQPILKEKDYQLTDMTRNVVLLESKRDSLIEINKSGEGIKAGGLKFIEDGNANFEILGNVIECDAEYGKALEALFANTFDSLVAASNNENELNNWCSENKDQSLDLIIPNTDLSVGGPETIERLNLKGCEGVIAINDIIKVNNPEYQNVLNEFFNGFYIIDNLNTELALNISTAIQYKGLVSRDGDIFAIKSLNGVKLSLRSAEDLAQGVVQRNNQIKELTEEVDVKKENLTKLTAEVKELQNEIITADDSFKEIESKYIEANNNHISLKSSLESREQNHGENSNRLDILSNRKKEISTLRLELMESEEGQITGKESLEANIEELMLSISDVKERAEELKGSYEENREELLDIKAKASSFDSQLSSINSQINDVNSQIERYEEKIENNNELLETLTTEISQVSETITTLEEENQSQAMTMSDEEEALNLHKDELGQLLVGMQDREKEVKSLTSRISAIEKEDVSFTMQIEKIVADEELLARDIFEKYRVDLRSTLKGYLEIHSGKLEELTSLDSMYIMETEEGEREVDIVEYSFEKRFPGQLRESKDKFKNYRKQLNYLGEINWQAIEDYNRQKLRYEFLKQQEVELKKSLEDLEIAIQHIDEKSKMRFQTAFNEVNDKFVKVFPIIFGGGSARLEVKGSLDSIECGIDIIAQPPGKKMQSINLMSGGEKAMTAVSLIFSIFLVKPSPFCLLDEVDAPLDDANVGRFNELLREMSGESQFILITHNKKTMELNDRLYGVTMQEPGVSKAVSVQLQ